MRITAWKRNFLTFGLFGLGLSLAGCECDENPPISRVRGQLDVDQLTLDFGDVPLGATRRLAVEAKNTGEDTLLVCVTAGETTDCGEASYVAPEGSPYVIDFGPLDQDSGQLKIESGDSSELAFTFKPIEEGSYAATALLIHNGKNQTVEILLNGVGVQPRLQVEPQQIDFGDVTVDQQSFVDVTLTNQNSFAQPVTIGPVQQSASIFGSASAGGEVTPDSEALQLEVPGNGSITFKAWFRPVAEGEEMNTLPVSYCPSCNADLSLRGNGIRPQIQVEPNVLEFGALEEGQTNTLDFTISNAGNSPLTVNDAALTMATPPHFTIAPQFAAGQMWPMVLDPKDQASGLCPVGLTCEIVVSVTYTAQSPGLIEGAIGVKSNAWAPAGTDNTALVQINAQSNGPDIRALPRIVAFGTTGIGGSPVGKALLLENIGNRDLSITDIRLNTPTGEITMQLPGGQTSYTVVPGDSVNVSLSYAPIDAGADQAFVEVDSNDANEPTLTVQVDGFGGIPTACSISVAPSQVTFGLVERGRVATLPVEIRNGGAQPCSLSNIRLTGDPAFGIAAGGVPAVTVQPGSLHTVSVQYAPTVYGNHNTLLELDSDDPAQPQLQVPISGASAESNLLVVPSTLDFSVVPVTCRSPNRAVTIYNTGANAISLSSVFLDPSTSPEFELQPLNPNVPYSLPAGGSYAVNLRYHPADIGNDTGLMLIEHSESLVPLAVPLSGQGEINAVVTDNFQQLPTPAADILFVIDDSCSMSDEQAALGTQLDAFLSYANTEGIDYQIAVTTTDVDSSGPSGSYTGGKRGQFVEKNGVRIINRTTPNGPTTFNQMVTALGDNGSGYEQGLEAAYLALSDPLINTWNAGFLRTDAALAVIVVSDEEDYSGRAVSFYENFFRNIKGFQNQGMFSFSGVIIRPTDNPNCSSGGSSRGQRYAQVSQTTGGLVESICTVNWGQTLANIGLNTFGLKRKFFLSSQPVPTTISVTVNGQAVPSVSPGGQTNWYYDQATNSIEFSAAAIPQAGSNIDVTYTVACLP